jgi:hypothetical protein
MGTFDLLAGLPLVVESYALEPLALDVSSGFHRQTTVIHLQGGGEQGVGEDVVYDGEDHDHLQAAGPYLALATGGETTLGDFCARIDALDLFPAVGRSTRRRSTSRCAKRARRCMRRSTACRSR